MSEDLTKYTRFRFRFMAIGMLMFVLAYVLTDPDLQLITNLSFGTALVAAVVPMLRGFLYLAFMHLARKAFFDYLDLEVAIKSALKTSTGAGLVVLAMGLYTLGFAMVVTYTGQ